MLAIWDKFKENSIVIYPQRDIHIKKLPEAFKNPVPKGNPPLRIAKSGLQSLQIRLIRV